MKSRDEEEAWRQIVENYGETASVDDVAADEPLPEERSSELIDAPAPAPSPHAGWEDEGHFVPPPVPPLPIAEPKRLFAWAGVFLAPLIVLVAIVVGLDAPRWFTGLMLAWFVGGFAYLVATMPRGGRDPWDDGARI